MKLFDNHNHSNFSPDSHVAIENIAAAAAERGLGGVAITDHYDIDAPCRDDEFVFNPAAQQLEIDRVREITPITLLKGIEVGLQPKSLEKIKNFTKQYNFDTVIASIHFIDGTDPYYGSFYVDKTAKEAFSRTLEVMYETAVAYKDFDILGHFDYVVRYAPYPNEQRNITMQEYGEYIEPLLKFLAENGKTMEVNTKTYMDHHGYTPTLDLNILKRFRELGGEAISLGSDSHDCTRQGENFKTFVPLIKSCGFKHLVYYKERKPQYYKID